MPRALVLFSLLLAVPRVALAQDGGSVRLERSPCAFLPFSEDRLRELVELELGVDGRRLGVDGDADVVLRYALEPCEAGATTIRVEVIRGATSESPTVRESRVELAEVPLATVPRALALELVESLRAMPAAVGGAEPAIAEPATAEAAVGQAAASTPPDPVETEPAPIAPASPGPSATGRPIHPVLRVGILGALRNTPDTGAVLLGARLFFDVWPVTEAPLVARVDVMFAAGPASEALTLGVTEGGLTVSLWGRAAAAFALRFGPRIWIGHGWDFARPADLQRTSGEVMAGIGVRVGAELELGAGVALVLEGEVGTHFAGLGYAQMGAPAGGDEPGADGAYWSLDLGVGLD